MVFLHQEGDLKATTGPNFDIYQHGLQCVQEFGKNVQVEKKNVAYLKKLSTVDEQYLKDISKNLAITWHRPVRYIWSLSFSIYCLLNPHLTWSQWKGGYQDVHVRLLSEKKYAKLHHN